MRYLVLSLCIAIVISGRAIADGEADVFQRLDANGDGQVAAAEIHPEDRRLFDRLVRKADENDDGRLSRAEFVAGTTAAELTASLPGSGNPSGRDRQFDPRQLFQRLDRDRSGTLSKAELPDRAAERFEQIDTNNDGEIQLPEYTRVLAAVRSQMMRQQGRPNNNRNNNARNQRVTPEAAGRLFDAGDRNRDGKLSLSEVPQQRRANFRRLLDRVDDDNDNAVTREQFIRAVGQRP